MQFIMRRCINFIMLFLNIGTRFFFLSGFSSQTLTIHRTAGEGRGPSFIPLYHFHLLTNIETFICNFACEMTIKYFNRNACFYQTATRWDLPPYRIITWTSDFAPASSKEFLDIKATIECGFTLKRVRDLTRIYNQLMNTLFPIIATIINCILLLLLLSNEYIFSGTANVLFEKWKPAHRIKNLLWPPYSYMARNDFRSA